MVFAGRDGGFGRSSRGRAEGRLTDWWSGAEVVWSTLAVVSTGLLGGRRRVAQVWSWQADRGYAG